MAKIDIEVRLDHHAMQTMEDVLRSITQDFRGYSDQRAPLMRGESGVLRDDNGNDVGHWRVTE